MAWYNYNDLLSYNCVISFILSNRGGGKSFGAKVLGIKDFIKNKNEFVYIRRYDTEISTVKNNFFSDIVEENKFPNYEFKTKGSQGFIRKKGPNGETGKENPTEWSVLCHFIPLSTSLKQKSNSFPKVKYIIFDEVVVDDTCSGQHYLKNEPQILLELLSTIGRNRTTWRFLGLANSVSFINPHFSFWGININPKKRFHKSKNGKVVVELFSDKDFIEEMKNTPWGQLLEGTEYSKYAIENEVLLDSDAFLLKRPAKLDYKCSFTIEGVQLHVWWERTVGFYYIDRTSNGDHLKMATITDKDHKPNVPSIKAVRQKPYMIHLKAYMNENLCYFNNNETEMLFKTLSKYL